MAIKQLEVTYKASFSIKTVSAKELVHKPMRLKPANGAKTAKVITRRTTMRSFHQCSANQPSNTPVW